MTHSIRIKSHSVIACVDSDLWVLMSQQTLREEDLTEEGEEPIHEMVKKCYVMGFAPYGQAGKKTTTNIHSIISTVKFKNGPKDLTNMDRWIAYLQRLAPTSVEEDTNGARICNRSSIERCMRKSCVRRYSQVDSELAAVYDGLHPATQEYDARLLKAKKNPT